MKFAKVFVLLVVASSLALLQNNVTLATNPEEVSVDLSSDLRHPLYQSCGVLHAWDQYGENVPDWIVSPWNLSWQRFGEQNPAFWDIIPYDFGTGQKGKRMGANTECVVHSFYDIDKLVNDAIDQKLLCYWDLFNEPESFACSYIDIDENNNEITVTDEFPINTEGFHNCWSQDYVKVKAADPNAIIIGPSACISNTPDFYNAMENFLVYAKTNNQLPNYLTWHFSDDPVADAQYFRDLFSEHGITNMKLLMNEYLWESQFLPCFDAWYLCRNERADINANLAIWRGQGLCDTIWMDESNNWHTRGRWWVYKRYSEITGMLVNTTASSQNNPRIEILAGKDSEKSTVRALIGSKNNVNSEDFLVHFTNLSSTPYIIDNNMVHVIVERITNDDTVYAPSVIVDQNYEITNNQISINIGWGSPANAYAITLKKPISVQTQKDTLICDYSFDETSGSSTLDNSDNNNDGTISGNVNRVTGISGNAISLDGNSYVAIPNSNSFVKIDDELLLDFWIYPTTSGSFRRIIDKINTTQSGYEIQLTPENCVNFGVGSQGITTTESIAINQWTHIKATYKANDTMEIFYDGIVKAQSATDLLCIPNNSSRLTIGADVDSNFRFAGYIDRIKIKNSIDDIIQYSFNECSGNVLFDESGNDNNGTINGTTNRVEVDAFSGKSLYLNGSSYIDIADSDTLNSISDQMDIDLWVYPTISGVWQRLIDKPYDPSAGVPCYLVQITPDNKINFVIGAGQSITTYDTVTPYRWNRINVTYKRNDKIKIYINDSLKSEVVADDINIPQSNYDLMIGTDYNGITRFTGYIDSLRIDSSVSDDICKYSFEETTENKVIDTSNNIGTGTIAGTICRVAGQTGTALSLNGSSNVTVSNTDAFYNVNDELTIDFWIYPTVSGVTQRIVDKAYKPADGIPSFLIQLNSDNHVCFVVGSKSIVTNDQITINAWNRIKATYRKNDVMQIYINDLLMAQVTVDDTSVPISSEKLMIGSDYNGNFKFTGYIYELSVRCHVEEYICKYSFEESNGSYIADTSGNSNGGDITGTTTRTTGYLGHAISLNGNSYITIPESDTLNKPQTELTVDLWIYPTVSGTIQRIVDKAYDPDAGIPSYLIQLTTDNRVCFMVGNQVVCTDEQILLNTWNKIRVTYRRNDKIRIYINSNLEVQATANDVNILNSSTRLRIGADYNGNNKFTGLIDELTIQALVNDNICHLVFNESRGSSVLDRSTYCNNGIVVPGTADRVVSINGKAISFDGSTCVKVPQVSSFSNIKDELLIEFWFKPTAIDSWQRIVDKTDSNQNAFLVQMTPSGEIVFAVGTQGITSTNTIQANQWSKITVTYKKNDKIRIYINNTLCAEDSTTNIDVPSNDLWMTIGADINGSFKVHGFIDDLRITNSLKSLY